MSPASLPGWAIALVLGVVEGVTEFIPVSSTGHLIIASEWLGFTGERAKTFEVFIQLGAILAIAWLYRRLFFDLFTRWYRDLGVRRLVINLAIAFLPAALVGLLIHDVIKTYLFNPVTVAWALVAGGIAMLVIERWNPPVRTETVAELAPSTALGIGLAQVLSLFPGVSRSGATIMGGYALGLSRRAATEFSFFLAVPVMFAATLFDLFESREHLVREDLLLFSVGFVAAFVSALIVVQAFLGFVSRRSFVPFAWYRIGFGSLLLGWYWLVR